ncbi:MAG: PAS domain S-box protein, partial [Limisphaerales bacterium]
RENELRYRLLWEHSNDGVVLMDAAGWILFSNPAMVPMFGLSDTTLLGKHMGYLGGLGGKDSEQAPFVQELLQSNGQLMEFIGVREDGVMPGQVGVVLGARGWRPFSSGSQLQRSGNAWAQDVCRFSKRHQ